MNTKTPKKKSTRKRVAKIREAKEDSGLTRLEGVYLDRRTLERLERLTEQFGYRLSRGEKTYGFQAIITLAIEELARKIKDEAGENVRYRQQRVLVGREIDYLRAQGYKPKEIAERFNQRRLAKRLDYEDGPWSGADIKALWEGFGKNKKMPRQ